MLFKQGSGTSSTSPFNVGRRGSRVASAVVWEGDSLLDGKPIVMIATGLMGRQAPNSKTGDVVQTWIVRRDVSVFEALRSGEDFSVCGDCALRPEGPGSTNRACFVHSGMVNNIWDAYRAGKYPAYDSGASTAGRVVRMGAYGDPAAVPFEVWEWLLAECDSWVGYTHSWRLPSASELKDYVMASVDSPEEAAEAQAAGWRTFRTRLPDEPLLAMEIVCPATPEGGKKTTCEKCSLCDGVRYENDPRRNITDVVHGWTPAVAAYASVRGVGFGVAWGDRPKPGPRPLLPIVNG